METCDADRQRLMRELTTRPAFQRVISEIESRPQQGPPPVLDAVRHRCQSYAVFLNKMGIKAAAALHISHVPKKDEVVTQANILIRDFIHHSLHKRGVISSRQGDSLLDVSSAIIQYCGVLERRYTDLYRNIGSQVNIRLNKPDRLRATHMSLARHVLQDGITWGRVLSLFSLTGALAVEAVQAAQPQHLKVLISSFCDIVKELLADWIVQEGGWSNLTFTMGSPKEAHLLWMMSVGGAAVSFIVTSLLFLVPH